MLPAARVKFLVQSLNKILGIYIHIPFCLKKCGYCDFFSFSPKEKDLDLYLDKIIKEINRWSDKLCRSADSLYIGGGTPSVLGTNRINKIILAAKDAFNINGEITVECNPSDNIDFSTLLANRISFGLQSTNDKELAALNRRHNFKTAKETFLKAKKYFDNISVDVMMGIPYQTKESLTETLKFITDLEIPHISSYMLKIEENTPFYNSSLPFLDEDEVCDLYLLCCNYLKERGYFRYEISNFCKKGYESKHNLKYWQGKDYLGIGPSAHSRIDNKRFYYERDYNKFLNNTIEIYEGDAGSLEENIMLALRTSDGFNFKDYPKIKNTALRLAKNGLISYNNDVITLTDKGALLENMIIAEIINNLF